MRTDLLLRHADFLDNLPVERFDFGLIGWLNESFPESVSFDVELIVHGKRSPQGDSFAWAAAELFEMSEKHSEQLFCIGGQYRLGMDNLDELSTPQQVATLIRQYCEKYGDTP